MTDVRWDPLHIHTFSRPLPHVHLVGGGCGSGEGSSGDGCRVGFKRLTGRREKSDRDGEGGDCAKKVEGSGGDGGRGKYKDGMAYSRCILARRPRKNVTMAVFSHPYMSQQVGYMTHSPTRVMHARPLPTFHSPLWVFHADGEGGYDVHVCMCMRLCA